jgi:hypothetical protein
MELRWIEEGMVGEMRKNQLKVGRTKEREVTKQLLTINLELLMVDLFNF